ncbi:MAG: bifunctional 4-hydroxy-2-oxoglutarate aldolase/2-dehydro-3-deoxy-phosphogluconate aldolase [Candidatus Omnitrophota bacterium]
MVVEEFEKLPILGILRGIKQDIIEPLIQEVISSGLKTIEITMNTKDACELICKTINIAQGRLVVGAGTVLTMDSLRLALNAGASFIVTPVLVEDVLKYCVKNNIPCFPGALTPLEIYNAWQRGAAMVKVFPAKFFGPAYFKEIKGPFNDVKLLACSGVTPENIKDYFLNGANAVSFGSSVFKKELLDKKDFKSIGENIKKYLPQLNNVSSI